MEFVWKDSNRNVLPEAGVEVGAASIELQGSELTVQRGSALEAPQPGKFGEATLSAEHPKAGVTVFSLKPAAGP
jgi:hypothetical protein